MCSLWIKKGAKMKNTAIVFLSQSARFAETMRGIGRAA